MLRLQAVDRDDEVEEAGSAPLEGNRPDGARHHLSVDSAPFQRGKEFGDLPPADQRLTTHDRQVERAMSIDQGENSFDELGALEIPNPTERARGTEVPVAVRIAAGA
jgi:hypothetical protein